ncbi:MAG: hypothetical protein KDA22_14870 [Phycisphaerales bacterium]|nr:hypothetical protein [Phycisphaerales bacterium]
MSATALGGAIAVPTAVVLEGQTTAGANGALVTLVNTPFVSSNGKLGFVGAVDNGSGGNNQFVWWDGAIVWLNSDALPIVLTGGEGTMGTSNEGAWIYSPSDDGDDSVWSNGAKLLKEGDDAPGLAGLFISFASRPQMNDDGTPTWISGTTATPGGSSQGRVLYSGSTVVVKSGDSIDGLIVSPSGVGFAYDFSGSGEHWVIECTQGTSTSFIVLDGAAVAVAGESAPDGSNWQGFDDCAVNDAGSWIASGDTDAAVISDGFLVLNGSFLLREGDNVNGRVLAANPRAIAISNAGKVGAMWNTDLGETLFVASPVADARGSVSVDTLLAVGDLVDTDGDGVVDSPVTDFNASPVIGPGLRLADCCVVYVEVDVSIGGTEFEAVVGVPYGQALVGDINGDGIVDGADLGLLLAGWGTSGDTDLNNDGTTDGADLGILLGNWS